MSVCELMLGFKLLTSPNKVMSLRPNVVRFIFCEYLRLETKPNRRNICQVLNMVEADERSKYLGLPCILGRNKSALLGYLKDKVTKKINSWDGRWISKGGKEILIKSVAQTLPSFAMSVFLLPAEITKDIERTLAKYWWSSSSNKSSNIHWMSWDRLSKHKTGGGMGFRDFRDFNLAMLGKQGWRLFKNTDSLVSKVFKARYFTKGNFLTSKLGHNPSYVWRSIWEAKELVKRGTRWMIATGDNIDICDQPWLADEVNPYVTSESQAFAHNKVSALMCDNERSWDVDIIKDLFNERDQQCILNTPLSSRLAEDTAYWRWENSGSYSVKSAYRFLQEQKGLWNNGEEAVFWRQLWRIKAPAKVLNTLWRACSSCLPTL